MPTLDAATVDQTSTLLVDHDLVLGPAADGGYYLIALRGHWNERIAAIFEDVPWSQPEVFAITIARAAQLGLKVARLPQAEDVDTVVELIRLRAFLERSPSDADRTLHEQLLRLLADHELDLRQWSHAGTTGGHP